MKKFCLALVFLQLAGCSGERLVDVQLPSVGQNSRVQYVVVHYTSSDLTQSLKTLTQGQVSSHYVIGDQKKPLVYQLVSETQRAWHAGDSQWQGRTWLNGNSIGIELVHPGYRDIDGQRHWYPYSEAQIEKLIALLQDIKARHQLPVDAVIGHSDIAPQRKVDPGPLFPWQRLAQAGLIRWPTAENLAEARAALGEPLPEAHWFQQQLHEHGYGVALTGEWDAVSQASLSAFQMKYRPQDYQGLPDQESAVLLLALNSLRRN